MSRLSKSPDRNTFQRDNYLKRKAAEGLTPENNKTVANMAEYYANWDLEQSQHESDPDWANYNLEYDFRSTEWILEKVRASDAYAQNLYAAMCNNKFQKLDTYPILANKVWSCSWRSAGGIVANMRQSGDYIDWYCSGIFDEGQNASGKVAEGDVTEEIADDLNRLGWRVIETNE
jgi:hypothetical protein